MTWTNLVPWDLLYIRELVHCPGQICMARNAASEYLLQSNKRSLNTPLCTRQLAGFCLKLFWPLENLRQKSISRTIAVWGGHIGVRLQNQGSGVPDVDKDLRWSLALRIISQLNPPSQPLGLLSPPLSFSLLRMYTKTSFLGEGDLPKSINS